jgi:sulfhydrogenase subunit beta (sulfur reductase)
MSALLASLVQTLRARGYLVVGLTVRDGEIVLAELESADALPYGWGITTGPGHYRLRQRDDRAAFGDAAGPQPWKAFLHPARSPLWTADRTPGGSPSPHLRRGDPGRPADE